MRGCSQKSNPGRRNAARRRFATEAANRERYARGERSFDINGLRGVLPAGGA